MLYIVVFFFFQAEDGIRDLVRSRGLGDVYKRQVAQGCLAAAADGGEAALRYFIADRYVQAFAKVCLLYTSDAADERSSVDLGGRRIIKKKKQDACDASREIEKTSISRQRTLQQT